MKFFNYLNIITTNDNFWFKCCDNCGKLFDREERFFIVDYNKKYKDAFCKNCMAKQLNKIKEMIKNDRY